MPHKDDTDEGDGKTDKAESSDKKQYLVTVSGDTVSASSYKGSEDMKPSADAVSPDDEDAAQEKFEMGLIGKAMKKKPKAKSAKETLGDDY